MSRPQRFDVLFEPVRIGPVTAKNRFYQVPHCNGMGRAYPSALTRMREIKAEGDWGVVCTEQCDIHHSTNHLRSIRLWDDKDSPALSRIADAIHRHGSLAGIELAHNGFHIANLESRSIPIAPSSTPTRGLLPVHARAMDLDDIRAARRWHRAAAKNAKRIGFDIIYVYAGHDMTLPVHFLSRRHNRRTDEYGGSLKNRLRLLRELIEDAKEAVGDTCAIAVRFGIELSGIDGLNHNGEGREAIELLSELPDLWDVSLSTFENDGQTSRFAGEAFQERYVDFVKSVTSKPVVGVGRFTSPDTMVAMINHGVLDFIGAARPSIADPFLPKKIFEGRFEDIRECIGCNICVATDKFNVPIRCTQNPTMGEEWRRDWHPEKIPSRDTDDKILIIGGGPAGLEAARALGQRGYDVILAERSKVFGGRVLAECRLPGLSDWRRVVDWRIWQLKQMTSVMLLPGNEVNVEIALDVGASLVVIATGSVWRANGLGRSLKRPLIGLEHLPVFTPDDILAGRLPKGRVVLFDDDHYYMGGVIAELLTSAGVTVTFLTPESLASAYTQYTGEQKRIHRRLLERCAGVQPLTTLSRVEKERIIAACVFTGQETVIEADALVLVTASEPQNALYYDLIQRGPHALASAGIRKVRRIGDCLAPGTIAAAVYSGHLFARTLDSELPDETPYRRELVELHHGRASYPTIVGRES